VDHVSDGIHPRKKGKMTMHLDRNKKLKVVAGIAGVAVAAVAIGAGTYAAFTDTETDTGTAAAGTLDLELGGTGTQELFTAENMQPGDTEVVTFTVQNVGTLPGTLDGTLQVTGDDGGACTEPETAAGGCTAGGNLQEQLMVELSGPGLTDTEPTTISEFAATGFPAAPLAAGAEQTYTLTFTLPDSPDNNKVQGDSIAVAATLDLEQITTP
jgi:predicted ribosomally synthesized peptide with SipW-like signal peptide